VPWYLRCRKTSSCEQHNKRFANQCEYVLEVSTAAFHTYMYRPMLVISRSVKLLTALLILWQVIQDCSVVQRRISGLVRTKWSINTVKIKRKGSKYFTDFDYKVSKVTLISSTRKRYIQLFPMHITITVSFWMCKITMLSLEQNPYCVTATEYQMPLDFLSR